MSSDLPFCLFFFENNQSEMYEAWTYWVDNKSSVRPQLAPAGHGFSTINLIIQPALHACVSIFTDDEKNSIEQRFPWTPVYGAVRPRPAGEYVFQDLGYLSIGTPMGYPAKLLMNHDNGFGLEISAQRLEPTQLI